MDVPTLDIASCGLEHLYWIRSNFLQDTLFHHEQAHMASNYSYHTDEYYTSSEESGDSESLNVWLDTLSKICELDSFWHLRFEGEQTGPSEFWWFKWNTCSWQPCRWCSWGWRRWSSWSWRRHACAACRMLLVGCRMGFQIIFADSGPGHVCYFGPIATEFFSDALGLDCMITSTDELSMTGRLSKPLAVAHHGQRWVPMWWPFSRPDYFASPLLWPVCGKIWTGGWGYTCHETVKKGLWA